jgi:hypothetical protein
MTAIEQRINSNMKHSVDGSRETLGYGYADVLLSASAHLVAILSRLSPVAQHSPVLALTCQENINEQANNPR